MVKKYLVSNKGLTLPLVLFIFLFTVLVTYTLVTWQGKEIIVSVQKDGIDKALQLADAGVEIAIGYLRSNPNLLRSIADNDPSNNQPRSQFRQPIDPMLNGQGRIVFTVDDGENASEKIVISSGIYTTGKWTFTKAVRAVLEVESPGNYFCASATKFIVGDETDMHKGNGVIYGNILEFWEGDRPSNVYRAMYTSQCIPSDNPPASYVTFTSGVTPETKTGMVLPVISQEMMEWYYDIAYNNNENSSFLTSPLNDNDFGLPAQSNVWYFPAVHPTEGESDDPPIQDLEIDLLTYDFLDMQAGSSEPRSCVIVVNGNLIIKNHIYNAHYDSWSIDDLDDTNDTNPNIENYALAFIVRGHVILDTTNFNEPDLRLQGVMFIATNGRFTVHKDKDKVPFLRFYGSALFRDSFDIGRGFDDTIYYYDQTVKDIQSLPFMVNVISYQPR